jgi:hypothetical protein
VRKVKIKNKPNKKDSSGGCLGDRVARLSKISQFGLLFKGPNMACCRYLRVPKEFHEEVLEFQI